MVGLGEVQITFSKGVPLKLDKTVYTENITLSPTMESITMMKEKAKECLNRGRQAGCVENVEIVEDCDNQQESKDCIANDTQSEVISLATPPGYKLNNECKVD